MDPTWAVKPNPCDESCIIQSQAVLHAPSGYSFGFLRLEERSVCSAGSTAEQIQVTCHDTHPGGSSLTIVVEQFSAVVLRSLMQQLDLAHLPLLACPALQADVKLGT